MLIRPYSPADRYILEHFKCVQQRENWGRPAQKTIRSAPRALDLNTIPRLILVAENKQGEIVGAIVVRDDLTRPNTDYVEALGVRTDLHGHRIGPRLKRAVMTLSASKSPPRMVSSHVHERNNRMNAANDRVGVTTFDLPDSNDHRATIVSPRAGILARLRGRELRKLQMG